MAYKIAAIIILLVFSAFFSGSETALFSLDPLKLRKLKRRAKNVKDIKYLLQNPLRLLATILIGNTIVNITASAIAGSIAIDLWGDKGVGISIGVMTFLLLLFGEVSPKRYAIERPIFTSLLCAKPLTFITKMFLPIHWLVSFMTGMFPLQKKEPTLTEEELKAMIDRSHKEGVVAEHEKELIGAVLGFTDTIVGKVMVPRQNIKAVPIDIPQSDLTNFVKEVKHSKIPVYKNTLDNVMGILYTKELFLYPEKPFGELVKPVLYVESGKKIKDVLRMFEEQNIKIAIVLNEKGITCGLVAIEDILEEVFGEIYDEFEILAQVSGVKG